MSSFLYLMQRLVCHDMEHLVVRCSVAVASCIHVLIENFVMIESKGTNGWLQACNLLLVCGRYYVLFLLEA